MSFLDYIKGQRKGKEAHRIEKDSMTDVFLYEAIEGFDSVGGNHSKRISDIQKRIRSKTVKQTGKQLWQSAAAAVIIVAGVGGYFLADFHKSGLHAQNMAENRIIDVYVPKAYYSENIAVISRKNTEMAKAYKAVKPNISRFSIEDKENPSMTKEEQDMLSGGKSEEPIDIYVPEDFGSRVVSSSEEVKSGKPEPVCGYEKYGEYLKKSLRRPTDDMCKDRKGKVAVEFSVNSLGQPFLFEVKYSLCGTCDNEAVRLIQSGPRWTTGSKERVRVNVEF
jgi:hypothetical protein